MKRRVRQVRQDVCDRQPREDRHKTRIIEKPEKSTEQRSGHRDVQPIRERNRKQRIEEEILRACIAEGMTREESSKVLDVTETQYAAIEKRLLANDGQRMLIQTSAHRYYIYCLQQEQCVRDLDFFIQTAHDAVKDWKEQNKQIKRNDPDEDTSKRGKPNAMPNSQSAILAVKAKSEILERTVKLGQDLGIIEKRAKEVRISGQINLAALPTDKLRTLLAKRLDQMQSLVDRGAIPTAFEKMLPAASEDLFDEDEPESCVDAVVVEANA